MTGRVFPAPGSFLWLAAHDLKLSWRRFRGMFGKSSSRTAMIVLVCAIACFHLLAYPVAKWCAQAGPGGANERHLYPALASAVLFIVPWLVSQALTSTTRALYTRNDLDLLLSSPLPPPFVLAARALAIASESIGSVAVFILPLANMIALIAGWRWLAIYPVLLVTGLAATAVGIWLTIILFRIAGPRRTRMISQILATIIGASFVFLLQALHVIPEDYRNGLVAAIENAESDLIFNKDSWLWLPVRAAAGEWTDILLWSAISVAAFAVTAALLGKSFAASAVESAGAGAGGKRRGGAARIRFRSGLGRALRRKEWRLVGRDPWLLSQLMLQVIYTLPVSVVIWRSQGVNGSLAISVGPAIVVIAAQVAASLAWLTISSEDAPEFLASAPVSRREVERRKLEAVAVPLLWFLGIPMLLLIWLSPVVGVLTGIFAAGAAASTSFLNFWHPMPGRRVAVLRRHSQSKLIAIMEHLLALLWALAMVMAVLESAFVIIPLALIGAVLWFNRPRPSDTRTAAAIA